MSKITHKGKILVVDDEESLREICREALVEHGYDVIEAKNGKEAAQLLKDDKDIDIVLSDLNMPEMDGMALIEHINRYNLDVELVVMTGFGTIETAVEVMKKGALDYIPKPFYLNHLLVKIDSAMKRREEKKQRERLDKLVQILKLNRDLNAKLDLSALLNEFLFHVERTFSPEGTVIFVKGNGELHPDRVRGSFKNDPVLLKKVKEIIEYLVRKRRSSLLFIPGKIEDEDLKIRDKLLDTSRQIMISPLISKSGIIGSVCLTRGLDSLNFNFDDLQLLTVFCSQTAAILENAKLYNRVWEMNREIIRSLAKAVEAKDLYTKGHSDQVAYYAVKLGRRLGLDSNELDKLYWSGIVHDVGKIGIPDNILNKPGKLTDEEFDIMKRHPVIGKEILSQIESLRDIMPIIYHHHERIDGRGYPERIKGDEIPFLAKIISVVDAYDAMTSDRAYRMAMEPIKAASILESGAGMQWDPELVDNWLKVLKQEKKI
ncbi:response regulator [Desulfothermus okinawensis JCM 13304]